MKNRFRYNLLLSFLIGWACITPGATLPAQERSLSELEQQAFQEVAAKVAPAMVQIETVGGREMIGGQLTATAASTGVVLSPDGYIITSSYHYLAEPDSILVRLADGRRLPARLVAQDSVLMVTLLKIEADNLLVATPAPRETIRVGQWAIGLGKTYDVAIPNMTVGIVSALDRVWGKANIQTDAKISPVNYGGPMVNLSGQVMGILVPLSPQASGVAAGTDWYDSGIGFAVSLEKILNNLTAMKQGTNLKPGLLGVGLPEGGQPGIAAKIEQVRFGSPAEKAGLKKGDVVVEVDGKAIATKTDFQFAVKPRYAGETLNISARRGEELSDYAIKLTDELLPYEKGFLGILPSRENALEQAAETSPEGVGIRYVYPNSPAEQAGLKVGERILQFEEQKVESVSWLQKQLGLITPGEPVKLEIQGDGQQRIVELQLSAQPQELSSQISPVLIPAIEEPELQEKLPETGHFTENLEELKHRYWAYVPEDYHPGYAYGLILWLHSAEQANEAATLKKWKQICDARGVIFLAPQAAETSGWEMEELAFLKELVGRFKSKYRIDTQRLVVHGADKSGQIAMIFGLQNRKLISGVALDNTLLPRRLPENTPTESLQLYLRTEAGSQISSRLKNQVKLLEKQKYSYIWEKLKTGQTEGEDSSLNDQLSLWLDTLDRL